MSLIMTATHDEDERPTDAPSSADILARAAGLDGPARWAQLVNAGERFLSAGRSVDARTVLEAVISELRSVMAAARDRQVGAVLSAALVNLATVEIAQGAGPDLHRADALLAEAQELAEHFELDDQLGTIEVNRARIASLRGEVGAARRALDRAEKHYVGGEAPSDLAWVKRALGASLAAAGQLEQALVLQIQARDLFRDNGDELDAATTEIGLVAIRTQLGQHIPDEEQTRLEQLSEHLPTEAAFQLLGNLANLALTDDPDRAEELWRRARDRATNAGRVVDQARADLALAGVIRRRGHLRDALQETVRAGERLGELGAWEAAARAQINAALLLGLIADDADPASSVAVGLRRKATEHIGRGITALDRLRHSLPSPSARRDLLRNRYPQLFVVGLDAAMRSGDHDLAAALIERARMQPALGARRVADDGYAEPPHLASRPGATGVDGQPPRVDLISAADRLAGPGARWIGWWRDDADLLRSIIASDSTEVIAASFPEVARAQLDGCLARVSPVEAELSARDAALGGRLALARCAGSPLLGERQLAERVLATIPPRIRRAVASRADRHRVALDDVLWPLAQAMLGDGLLHELMRLDSPPTRLVLAPPPLLADVPWPLLPLRAPRPGESPMAIPRLLDAAEIVVGLPAALVSHARPSRDGHGTVAVLDPLGDLPFARGLDLPGRRLGHGQSEPATSRAVIDALADAALLVASAHVQPGSPEEPATAGLVLSDGSGGQACLSVAQLATVQAPAVCVILGCDGSGGTVADEWTGLATGLLWAGADWILTSTWPTIEDRHTASADTRLVTAVQHLGPQHGFWSWQRDQLARWRSDPRDRSASPYRWAGTILCGRGSAPLP